jgi:hypothetical protein
MDNIEIQDLEPERFCCSTGGAGGDRTHDLTDYESAALTS